MSSEALERGYTCPITNCIMFSPTIASDGHTYELHAIQVWVATALDNDKQPLSPTTGLPLTNLVLRPNVELLREIEKFVIKNKLQQHPDRVQPPSAADIEKRQKDISEQAAEWLVEATPGKQMNQQGTDMGEYATLSAQRRKEEIASGADLTLAVRSARSLADLLRQLDCVHRKDTLAEAIGNAVDYLSPDIFEDCFYICRERNRIVHENSAGDELTDVQRFRSAVRRATREIQVQIDIQNSYYSPTANPTSSTTGTTTPASAPQNIGNGSNIDVVSDTHTVRPVSPSITANAATIAQVLRSLAAPGLASSSSRTTSPPSFIRTFNYGVSLFTQGKYDEAVKTLSGFVQKVDDKIYPNRRQNALLYIEKAKTRPADLKLANDAFAQGDKVEAFKHYKELVYGKNKVLFEEDCYVMVVYRLALCCDTESSIKVISLAIEKEPTNYHALRCRGHAYVQMENYQSAKADFEVIVANHNYKGSDTFAKVLEDLETCRTKTDPQYKVGHLDKDELDELMAKFGLED